MASWIYSLARNRETNQDESDQGYPSQDQGNQDQHNQELRAENQEIRIENQDIWAKLGMMEAQMLEMAMLMLNGPNKNAIAAAANIENSPSIVSEPVQIISTKNNEIVAAHHVPSPITTPETMLVSKSPAVANPQIQNLNPRNTTHSRDPHVNPALVSVIHPHDGVNGFPQDYSAARDKYQWLEEQLRTNEEWKITRDPSLVPNGIPSPVFKLPEFVKFEGMTCPALHVDMYYQKMLPLTKNDGVLVYHFQNSLAGEALRWYMQLKHAHTMSLKELVCTFMKRFKYNLGMDPDRMQLQHMAQRGKETFKEYALRWGELATQVKPPLFEKEMIGIFMDTLPPLYYDQLIGSSPSSFKDLVLAGEKLESGVRNGKTAYDSTEATPMGGSGNVSYSPKVLSQIPYSSTQARKSQRTLNYPERKPRQFNPNPMSYSDLFDHLISRDLISVRPMKPYQPPFPRGYDPDATCKFHAEAVGHSVEDCKALKHVVQDLIDSKQLNIDGNNVSDSSASQSKEANIRTGEEKSPQCDLVPMSYTDLCSYLISHAWVTPRKMGPVQPPFPRGHDPEATCKFHLGAIGHSADNCPDLKNLVQGLVDTDQLIFEKGERSSSQSLWTIKQE